MKKKLTIVVLLVMAVFFISYFINLSSIKKAETIDAVTLLREKHTFFLNNSPFKKTLKLSKKERKAQGLPPNKYYERMWELTMNPATGKPEPNKVLELQKNRNKKDKSLSAKNPGDAVSNSWEERGPNNIGGRTRVVLFDPNDPTNKRVFAGGVSGGLWKNEDITSSSSSWTLIPDVPGNMNISCITVDPNNPLVWYIGTGEQYTAGAAVGNGVYKTTNGGVTWTNIPVQLAGVGDLSNSTSSFLSGIFFINDIVAWNHIDWDGLGNNRTEIFIGVGAHFYADAANPNNWLGLQSAGLYKTIDNGANWSRIESSNMEFQWSGYNFYFIPNDFEISTNNTLWMGSITTPGIGGAGGGRIFSSTNGIIWSEAGASPLPNSDRVELAVSSSNPSKLYALTEGTTSAGPHIYATTNAFSNFTELAKPEDADIPYPGYDGIPANDFTRGQDFYNLVIEVDPTNDNIVYVGGIDLFRTTQGENTNLATEWEQISKWSNNSGLAGLNCSLVHADQHAFTFRPGNSNQAVIGGDGGVYYANGLSTSATTNNAFSVRNNNFNITQFYYGGYGPNAANELIIAGAQDNGTQFFNGATPGINSSEWANGGDGAYSEIDTDEDYMIVSYVYNNYKYLNLPNYQTGYSLNNGSSGEGDFINQAGLDHNLNILFSNGTSGTFRINRYILGSSNATKTQLSNALLTNASTAFKVSPFTTASTTLLVGTADGKLLKLTNAESAITNAIVWEELSGGLFLGSISDIEFGATEDEIFVTFHNYGVTSIWYTLDGGTNWLNKEGNLPDMPVKCILQNPLVPNEVILGTELGVWATSNFSDASPNWISSYNGMQDVKVVDLDLRSDNTVLATTFGRGVFTGKFLATDFTITTLNSTVTTCNNTAVFNFDFNTNASYNTLTTFSTSGEPAGVTINFSSSSLNTQGTFSMTVSNVSSLTLGDYPITVIGTGNDTSSIDVILRIDDDTINIVNPTSPLNEATDIAYFGTNFDWDTDVEATSYDFDIATDAGFNTIVESTNIETNSFTITNSLNTGTVYYWRVRSKNECNDADYSETQKFQTKTSQCISESISPSISIPDGIAVNTPGVPLESIINIPNNFAISDVNVAINISHTYIQDLVISLISPPPSNTEVILFNRECTSEDDIDVVYNDDAGTIIDCASPVSGNAIPTNPLSGFNTEYSAGDWILKIEDYYNADQGTLNSWSLELCENQPVANSNLTKADPITVNSTIEYSLLQTDLNATSAGSTDAEQIYMLVDNPTKGDLKLNGTPLNIGDTFTQDAINNGFVSYLSTSGVTTTDAFKIDITNATNGFLPNQQININIDATSLSIDNQFFKKTKTLVFPTVSNGEFSIISNTSLGKTTIEIFNINGQRVFINNLNFRSGNKENIITNGLASGVYILKLSAESAQGTKKIIIK